MTEGELAGTLDMNKTIEDLEAVRWPEPVLRSYVAVRAHGVRQIPLKDLTVQDIRLGLGQQVGLEYLVPLALEALTEQPLVEAELYRGDLLVSLLQVPRDFWQEHEMYNDVINLIVEQAFKQGRTQSRSWQSNVLPAIQQAYDQFSGKAPSRRWLRSRHGQPFPGEVSLS